MCGIAGYCLDAKHYSRIATSDLAGQMLYDIEHRGQHATGAAWINPRTGRRVISKAATSATNFVPKAGARLCEGATTAILHTRYATQGSPQVASNNHPIPRGKIVLTHNGHISNDTELFRQLGVPRVGQVDSEAVAALIAFSEGKPWEILPEIYGTAALAWIAQHDPRTLHLARVNSSPLWLAQASTGSLFYGSTKDTVENAAIMTDCELDWIHEASEGEYFKVRDGAITEYQTFKPSRYEPHNWWSTYRTEREPAYATELDYYGKYNQRKAQRYAQWWNDKEDLSF
jgi:glucosamine 6-phosphate synthetase-like amidotransferase/phosphosugar isomerase protein